MTVLVGIMIDGVLIYIAITLCLFSREIKKKKQNSHLDVKRHKHAMQFEEWLCVYGITRLWCWTIIFLSFVFSNGLFFLSCCLLMIDCRLAFSRCFSFFIHFFFSFYWNKYIEERWPKCGTKRECSTFFLHPPISFLFPS